VRPAVLFKYNPTGLAGNGTEQAGCWRPHPVPSPVLARPTPPHPTPPHPTQCWRPRPAAGCGDASARGAERAPALGEIRHCRRLEAAPWSVVELCASWSRRGWPAGEPRAIPWAPRPQASGKSGDDGQLAAPATPDPLPSSPTPLRAASGRSHRWVAAGGGAGTPGATHTPCLLWGLSKEPFRKHAEILRLGWAGGGCILGATPSQQPPPSSAGAQKLSPPLWEEEPNTPVEGLRDGDTPRVTLHHPYWLGP
jgi:hypothetical protein